MSEDMINFGNWIFSKHAFHFKLYPVIASVVIILLSTPVNADWFDTYLTTDCRPEQNRVLILPRGGWSPIPSAPITQDCTFNNGRHVRAKYGEGDSNGAGLAESRWLSVWIDKVKVVSRYLFHCQEQEGLCGLSFEVTADGLKTCNVEPDDSLTEMNLETLGQSKCQFTPNQDFVNRADAIEFPPGGNSQKPEAGTRVVKSGDSGFCGLFIGENEHRKRYEVSGPPGSKSSKELLVNNTEQNLNGGERMSFDFDNDGEKEDVYHIEVPEGNHWWHIYYVYRKDNKTVATKYPDNWGTNKEYYVLTPIVFEGKTYLIGITHDATTLLMPLPDGKVSEICAFDIVPENY